MLSKSLWSSLRVPAAVQAIAWNLIISEAQQEEKDPMRFPKHPPSTAFELVEAFPGTRFSNPVALAHLPGQTDALFVVEKVGRIRTLTLGESPERSTFLDITDRVRSGGERGLLGLAFHPNFKANGFLYVFYTAKGNGAPNRLARFQVDPNHPGVAMPQSEVILINQADDAGNHNGGDLHFGPDGYLYVALGDEGAANDTLRNSQRIDKDFFAGILRIDVDKRSGSLPPNPHPAASTHYAIPPDNPFVGIQSFTGKPVHHSKVRTEFWAVGLRNPWRMGFDPVTGLLYAGDVGQGRWEEVNIIVKGGNYGWNFREGTGPGPNHSKTPEGFESIAPVLQYGRGLGPEQGKSITGGLVYRGQNFSQLYGAYIFADYISGNIWAMRHDGNEKTAWWNLARKTGIAAMGIDPRQGDILLASHSSGRLLRLVQDGQEPDKPLPATLADTGAFQDLHTLTPNQGIEPYEINTPFWSDHAIKQRWFYLPDQADRIQFRANDSWLFPQGMIWIKHFELELVRGDPASTRRLETRFLVRHEDGIYGLTYRWDNAQENAYLVDEAGMEETFAIQENGQTIEQVWRYPSRSECLACHNKPSGMALGFHTAQLNRLVKKDGQARSQLLRMQEAGYFQKPIEAPHGLPAMAALDDSTVSLTRRVKSYLASNCAACHRPDGEALGRWDARYATPVLESGLIDGHLMRDQGDPLQKLVHPGNLEGSVLYQRITTKGTRRMPPVGSHVLDPRGVELMGRWIVESLPLKSYKRWSREALGDENIQENRPSWDKDGDGWSNLAEFYMGTDPTWKLDRWRLQLDTNSHKLRLPEVRHPDLSWNIETTPTLHPETDWQILPISQAGQGSHGYAGMRELSWDNGVAKKAFFRLVITLPNPAQDPLLP
ncbi:MAG: PQQ-dependent sugar dehydrogenase [Verrucomicrobiota bacterium]|nr:PQQ-dependent sugar dehydrogenase [Verrucomicrobiota bacterium]